MKLQLTLIITLFAFVFSAQAEDTVFVEVADTTVWEDNDTSYVTEANFPSADEDFRQIWMNVHIGCPDGHVVDGEVITNCGIWDYSVQIQVLQELEGGGYDTVEIARGATPYAGGWTPDWYHRWTVDVTDYAPLFDENTKIRSFFHGSTEGFLAFFDFQMIRGTPPREVLSVQEIYSNPNHEDASNTKGWPYGYPETDVNNEHLPPTMLTMPDDAETAMARVSIKGHGFGEQSNNCAEFCPKDFYLYKNGGMFVQQLIWRDNCDLASVFPQTGNWISPRTNWCPGMLSYTYDHEIPDVSGGETFEFEMNIEDNVNQPPQDGDYTTPRWLTDVQWFAYGPKNFDHNAGVKRIIAPSRHPDHKRFNPICDRPVIEIRNRGAETLTSLTIEYGNQGTWKKQYEWEGELGFMETDTVYLPGSGSGISPLFWGAGPFEVILKNPNGMEDEEPESARKVSYYDKTPEWKDRNIVVEVRSKAQRAEGIPQEISWFLLDNINEDTVAGRHQDEMDYATMYRDTIDLEDGCYTFRILDDPQPDRGIRSQSDGMEYFCFTDSTYWCHNNPGFFRIRGEDGFIMESLNSYQGVADIRSRNFGRENSFSFTVGGPMGSDDRPAPFPEEEEIKLYPNPARDELTIDLPLLYKGEMQARVFAISGESVINRSLGDDPGKSITLDVSGLEQGTYILQLSTSGEQFTGKFMVR